MKNYRTDTDLEAVLLSADKEDLAILIDIITDNGSGRISLDGEVTQKLIKAKEQPSIDRDIRLTIAEEIQKYSGNTLMTLLRGGRGILYREAAIDVADHLDAEYLKSASIAEIEGAILLQVLKKSLDKMSEEERRKFFDEFGVRYNVGAGPAALVALLKIVHAGGFAPYRLALIVANAVAKAVVGRGLALGANAALTRGIGIFTGPIGWAITAIWTAFDLASPAYRVTVPCVIQVAYMRQKAALKLCPQCQTPVSGNAKFCGECGHQLV